MGAIPFNSIAAPRRTKSRIALGAVDGRTRVAKRIVELRELFTAAVLETHGQKAADALGLTRIETAAVMLACAETGRASFLEGRLQADDLVRLENRAARAERALGLGPVKAKPPPAPTLTEMLAR